MQRKTTIRKTTGLDSSLTGTDSGTILGSELKTATVSGTGMGSGSVLGPMWNLNQFKSGTTGRLQLYVYVTVSRPVWCKASVGL